MLLMIAVVNIVELMQSLIGSSGRTRVTLWKVKAEMCSTVDHIEFLQVAR